jgi:hypothetical protein
MDNEIKIFLTTPEAIMFRDYQKFHETFALLCSKGVFDMVNGSITMHFDSNGTIQKIERHDNLYDSRIKLD